MKKLYLDFDKKFENEKPVSNQYIITDFYSRKGALNTHRESDFREFIFTNFLKSFNELDSDKNFNGVEKKMIWFTNFFLPLGQWILSIEKAIEKFDIHKDDEIIFTSFSKNKKIFLFESEGEVNRKFLYHGSFFLSYYIKLYLTGKGFTNINIQKDKTFESKASYWVRGALVVSVKSLQLFFYKFFFFIRKVGGNQSNRRNDHIILTRGVIQTQFIEGLNNFYGDFFTVIVNESSSYPFRNLKAAKKNIKNFIYAEGALSYKSLISEISKVIKAYFKPYNKSFEFLGIPIQTSNLEAESAVLCFNQRTYAKSIEQILKSRDKYNLNLNIQKLISFEMLLPFAYYIQKFCKAKVIQIQTTLISEIKHPSFVYSDKFYFNNKFTYENQIKVNSHFKEKLDFLHNIKFIGLKKKEKINKFKTLTYFTQPIHIDEEKLLILFLKDFCKIMNFKLNMKLHPRSKLPDINLSSVNVIKGTVSSQKVIKQSDVVVTRTSSIGVDAWFLNTPVLFFVNGTFKGGGINYIPNDYLGTIDENITVQELKSKFSLIINDFYKHRLHKFYEVEEHEIIKKLFNLNRNVN